MLSISLSPDISRLFREITFKDKITRDPSDHITMFYLGDNIPLKKLIKMIPIIFDITCDMKPFMVSCSKITTFPKGKNGYPIIGEIKSKDLSALRDKLKKEFEKNKIKYDSTFKDYKPHVTLGYSKNKPKNTSFSKINWSINHISLYGGDESDSRFFVNFPFTLGTEKIAKLANFCDLYYKAI